MGHEKTMEHGGGCRVARVRKPGIRGIGCDASDFCASRRAVYFGVGSGISINVNRDRVIGDSTNANADSTNANSTNANADSTNAGNAACRAFDNTCNPGSITPSQYQGRPAACVFSQSLSCGHSQRSSVCPDSIF